MQITTQIKLLPSKDQSILLENTMQEYINTANNVVNDYVVGDNTVKHTSKSVLANLPSALKKGQC